MSLTVDVSVLNVAGDVIVTINEFDMSVGTGVVLRDAIAKATGFPAMKVRVLSAAGAVIELNDKLTAVFSGEALGSGSVSICCALDGRSVALGPKFDESCCDIFFSTKAGHLCTRMLEMHDRNLGNMETDAWVYRAPDQIQHSETERLIKASFAEHLGPLIEVAMMSAFRDRDADVASCDLEKSRYVFEDEAARMYADLSTCQVWTRYIPDDDNTKLMRRHLISLNYSAPEGDGGLLSALVWRLLPSWKDLGPVLEILFLATSSLVRESKSASNLAAELEAMAASLGCFALAVAAVPGQGVSFWERRGFQPQAPLKERSEPPAEAADTEIEDTDSGIKAPEHITSEAVFELDACTELGDFLIHHMLLFTDCPLVAKVLKEE